MNIQEFAKMLDGRKYRNEINKHEEEQAKELGYVVVFGYSDDNMEFRGAINDEIGCYDGGTCYITKDGLLEICEDECIHYRKAVKNAKYIEALWCKGEYTWTYQTRIPHATFHIIDDDEKYCRGIVFDLNDLESEGGENE